MSNFYAQVNRTRNRFGASLSYDMVKAQDGNIKLESHENEGTLIIVTLPA